MTYRDSVGGTYKSLPARKENPSAKSTRANREGRKGRNKIKCSRYRAKIGKPNGPAQSGNKAGKNKHGTEKTKV